jgi:FHA domain-containing protein
MDTPHATELETPKPPSGLDIWQALRQELQDNLYPLRSVTLAPSLYHVYLHPDDFDVIDGIVSRIVDDVSAALTEEVARLNRESAPRRGRFRGWRRSTDEAAAQGPIEVPDGGWRVHIQPDLDGELPRGRIGVVSKLTVPERPEYGGTPTIVTVKTIYTDGQRSTSPLVSSSPMAADGQQVSPTAPASTLRATLEYRDEAGDHLFPMRKDLIKVGRGGSDAWVDVQVITTPKVSREHCWIRADADGRFFIRDVSTWGTSVNGAPIPVAVRSAEGEVVEPGPERELPGDATITLADAVQIRIRAEAQS